MVPCDAAEAAACLVEPRTSKSRDATVYHAETSRSEFNRIAFAMSGRFENDANFTLIPGDRESAGSISSVSTKTFLKSATVFGSKLNPGA
jgi:hypothetical protein